MLTPLQLKKLRRAPATPNRLQAAMDLLHLTQAALAEQVGMPQANISRLASGQQQPMLDTARRLADHFGCLIEDLWPSSTEAVAS